MFTKFVWHPTVYFHNIVNPQINRALGMGRGRNNSPEMKTLVLDDT